MEDVIEIPSSPGSSTSSSADKPSLSQFPKTYPAASSSFPREKDIVIELTDSDSDENDASSMKARRKTKRARQPEAGPSHIAANSATPLSPEEKTPLFLSEDEDDEPLVAEVRCSTPRSPAVEDSVSESNLPSRDRDLTPLDPISGYVAQILEIVPDVEPDHVHALIQENLATYQDKVVEPVLHLLFEGPTYPKVDKNGKRKRVNEADGGETRGMPRVRIDYGDKERPPNGGVHYAEISIEQLMRDFPYIPKAHIRNSFFANNNLYAPTYFFLAEEKKQDILPYNLKQKPFRRKGKGKGKALDDSEFEREREWLLLKIQEGAAGQEDSGLEKLDEPVTEDNGDGIECGCCFSNYPFEKMIQCPDAHLFCTSCMTTYASTLLGAHDANIVCMDQSGCKLAFTQSELRRFLTPKLMDLYDRVKQTKEIEMAGIEGLEECPFCEYKVVIENVNEKLFRCERNDCGAISCRGCKKLDHLPKSCKEVEDDRLLDGRHTIEEAMTRALMRNCPKCQKAFIKEQGCNKMTCPSCQTLSCYICRQVIRGYDHFNQTGELNGKCTLWDVVEKRHTDEVTAAAERAMAEYKRDHPEVNENDIKVDLPPPIPNVPDHRYGPGLANFQAQALFQGQAQIGFQLAQAHANAQALAQRLANANAGVRAAHAQARAAQAQARAQVRVAQARAQARVVHAQANVNAQARANAQAQAQAQAQARFNFPFVAPGVALDQQANYAQAQGHPYHQQHRLAGHGGGPAFYNVNVNIPHHPIRVVLPPLGVLPKAPVHRAPPKPRGR